MRRGACCGEKAVLVTVFVERPTRRRVSSNHHPNKIHHPITQAVIRNRGGGRGYDRKAELLRYSHCLRESARSTSTTPLHRPAAVASSQVHNQRPTTKIIIVQSKQRESRAPTCMGSLKNFIPNFIKSLAGSYRNEKGKKYKKKKTRSTSSSINTIVKSFQAQKKSGFFLKLVTSFKKRK